MEFGGCCTTLGVPSPKSNVKLTMFDPRPDEAEASARTVSGGIGGWVTLRRAAGGLSRATALVTPRTRGAAITARAKTRMGRKRWRPRWRQTTGRAPMSGGSPRQGVGARCRASFAANSSLTNHMKSVNELAVFQSIRSLFLEPVNGWKAPIPEGIPRLHPEPGP